MWELQDQRQLVSIACVKWKEAVAKKVWPKYKKAQADAPKCSGTFGLRQVSIKYSSKYKPASIKVWLTRTWKSAAELVSDKDVRNSGNGSIAKYKSIAKASMAFQANRVTNSIS
ncbi:hypothetical protein A3841_00300 [Pontibacter flavimaris]|uniref:Uncharacterized protein n=1 Tax=Pontibacter flavimaris TaxID=1797110 RepID=A0A1Q5PBY8_9BACT|nr:hypothetical protein A3841_00300 [Pontibacter flavimaris]